MKQHAVGSNTSLSILAIRPRACQGNEAAADVGTATSRAEEAYEGADDDSFHPRPRVLEQLLTAASLANRRRLESTMLEKLRAKAVRRPATSSQS